MDGLSIWPLLMGVLGGLAIFLFGLEQITSALKSVGGGGMSAVLKKLTKNRFFAAGTGAFVTAMLQSSSVTSVLVVGFVSAGLMSLEQSIGVIMGANIGSTVTAQVIAFDVSAYALWMVAIGYAAMLVAKRRVWSRHGAIVMGLGMMFLGMGIMSEATSPLRTYEPFIELMRGMHNPLPAIAVAAGFTALVQSSGATTGIVIVLASQGFITLEAGIALAFGANIGTCVTAGIAAIGKPREAVQAAVVHLLFNVLGVVIWIPLIGVLADAVVSISPSSPGLEGAERLAAETPRQIANAHTLFNVVNTLLFIGFTGPIARAVDWMVPRRLGARRDEAAPKFLQEAYLDTPAMALDSLRHEIERLGRRTIRFGEEAAPVFLNGGKFAIKAEVEKWRTNQRLFDEINRYVRKLSAAELTTDQSRHVAALTAVAGFVQSVGETFAVNMAAIARERDRRGVRFSTDTTERIAVLAGEVRDAFSAAIDAIEDTSLAHGVIDLKPRIRRLSDETIEHLSKRLRSPDPNRSLLYRLESQVVEILQREYYFAKKIAKEIVRVTELSDTDRETQTELISEAGTAGQEA